MKRNRENTKLKWYNRGTKMTQVIQRKESKESHNIESGVLKMNKSK